MISMHNKTINVKREALIEALKKNQTEHETEYAEALAAYRLVITKELQSALKVAKGEDDKALLKITTTLDKFEPPQDHRADYTNVIEMLEYSVDETLQLDENSFKAYVKNVWTWTESFKTSNTFYASAASAVGSKRR